MKFNMLKKSILIISLGAIFVFSGCNNNKATAKENNNFEVISTESINPGEKLTIVRYKNSGKKFVIYTDYRRAGITSLD